jgi:hypothetical protein
MTIREYLDNANFSRRLYILERETAKRFYKNEGVQIIKLNTRPIIPKGINVNGGILGVYSNNHQPTTNSLLKSSPKLAGSRYNF